MCVLPLRREGQASQQSSADITFARVMLLAVAEQVFAVLADALLKQTNGGGKKKKRGVDQYPQAFWCL